MERWFRFVLSFRVEFTISCLKKGIKEVVITGIHLASYGKEGKNDTSLLELLKDINQIEKIKRIRLGSLEPSLMRKRLYRRTFKIRKNL